MQTPLLCGVKVYARGISGLQMKQNCSKKKMWQERSVIISVTQTDPVPVAADGSRLKEGLRKILIAKAATTQEWRFHLASRAIACRVGWMKTCRWKRYRWSARWQAAASSQLYNLHTSRETNGTYAVPQTVVGIKSRSKAKIPVSSVKVCCNAM